MRKADFYHKAKEEIIILMAQSAQSLDGSEFDALSQFTKGKLKHVLGQVEVNKILDKYQQSLGPFSKEETLEKNQREIKEWDNLFDALKKQLAFTPNSAEDKKLLEEFNKSLNKKLDDKKDNILKDLTDESPKQDKKKEISPPPLPPRPQNPSKNLSLNEESTMSEKKGFSRKFFKKKITTKN